MSNDLTTTTVSPEVAKIAAPKLAELKKATEGFEAIFLKKLYGQMRSSVHETKVGDDFGKGIYDDMFNEALANSTAKSHSFGMAEMLYKEFAPRVLAQARTVYELSGGKAAQTEPGQEAPAQTSQSSDR